jgi:hypothetical protein
LKNVILAILLLAFSCATTEIVADLGVISAGEVKVSLEARPEARLEIIGDFSEWKPVSLSLNTETGKFEAVLDLGPGEYAFKILENDRYLSPEIFPDIIPELTYTQADGAGSTVGVWIVKE